MTRANTAVSTDSIWGVVDFVPSAETNFPDYRNKTIIMSDLGASAVIPREGEKIRYYQQLAFSDVVDPGTGRIDKQKDYGPDKLFEVGCGPMTFAFHLTCIVPMPK